MFLKFCVVVLYLSFNNNILALNNNISVKIDPNLLTNVISKDFVSFNIEPSFIFDSKGELDEDKLECMSKSLSPAYLRIKGVYIVEIGNLKRKETFSKKSNKKKSNEDDKGKFSFDQLALFFDWIKDSNFTPFVTLNNKDRNVNNVWDTKITLQILAIADTLNVGDSIWQLDSDCKSIPLPTYMNELKMFDSILEAYDMIKTCNWMITAGDLSQCIHDDAKEELKQVLSNNEYNLQAMFMNNESHLNAIDELNEEFPDSVKDIILYKSTDDDGDQSEDMNAINWMNTLGTAAFNGYAAVFRDINKDFASPSLIYYSSLLYKKLVGRRVLYISEPSEDDNVSVFAHCASLSGGPVPGGVTIFATNSDFETKSVSISLSVDDENSEIMQYVLYLGENGKIIVNNEEMQNEDDLQPIVQNVTPFTTLTVELPPKSFGFWVVSNTNIKLCSLDEELVENLFHTLNDNNEYYEGVTETSGKQPEIMNRNRREILDSEHFQNGPLNNYEMDSHKYNLNPVHVDSELIDNVLRQAQKNNDINNLKDLFGVLGQLASLVELQEEFLEISDKIFLSPFSQSFINKQNEQTLARIDGNQDMTSPVHTEAKVRVARSANVDSFLNSEQGSVIEIPGEEERYVFDELSRLTREAETKGCDELLERSHRERINLILNSIKNRKFNPFNTDNIFPVVQMTQPHEMENKNSDILNMLPVVQPEEMESKNSDILNMLPVVQPEEMESKNSDMLNMLPVVVQSGQPEEMENSNTSDVGIEDSLRTESMMRTPLEEVANDSVNGMFTSEPNENSEYIVGMEALNSERTISKESLLIVDPFYVNEENTQGEKEKISKPLGNIPTTSPLTTKSSVKTVNDLVKKVPNVSQEVHAKSSDDDTLESKVLQDIVGPPAPLMPMVYMDQLAAHIQLQRLKNLELQNKLKMAELQARELLNRNMNRLWKRSIHAEPLKSYKLSKKNHNLKRSPYKYGVDKKNKPFKFGARQNNIFRKKRFISNDIDEDLYEFDDVKPYIKGSYPVENKYYKVDLKTEVTEFTTELLKNENQMTASNKLVEEDPQYMDEAYTVSSRLVTFKPINDESNFAGESKSSDTIENNVDLTISWLEKITKNLQTLITNIQRKLMESWFVKHLSPFSF